MATQTPVVSDEAVRAFILNNFPSYAFVMSIPDVFNVFREALGPNGSNALSSAQLLSKLQTTDWWKTHGQSVQNYIRLQQTDPDTLNEQIQAKSAEVHQVANKMGLADNQVNIDQVTRNAIQYGWSAPELQEQLAAQAQYTPQAPGTSHIGTIDTTIAQLKKTASDYMVSIDDPTLFAWARDVAAGHHVVTDYTPILLDHAKGRFPTLASYIDQGITPTQYFSQHQQTVAKLLERGTDQVDLANDPKFSKIVNYTDPKTGAPRPMTLAETQSYVRSMDEWKKTAQGQQTAADATEGILEMFGKVAPNSVRLSGPSNAY